MTAFSITDNQKKHTHRILIISVFFGKLPASFDLWLNSVASNKDVDFILFCDTEVHVSDDIKNLKIVYIDFREFQIYLQRTLNTEILCTPYKLCDFKPCYGYLFREYIEPYDWYGYTDLDVIYGNIIGCLEKVDNDSEKIFSKGHLTLFKNNERNIQIFLHDSLSFSWEHVKRSNHIYVFDENKKALFSGINVVYANSGTLSALEHDFVDIAVKYMGLYQVGCSKKCNGLIIIRDHRLYFATVSGDTVNLQELIYVHFQKRALQLIRQPNGDQWYVPLHWQTDVVLNISLHEALKYYAGEDQKLRIEYISYKIRALKRRFIIYIKFVTSRMRGF